MASLQQSLTENFYRWEKRGRGWRVWKDPVELEPPFEPFFHGYSRVAPAVDDGRRPTRIGSWIEKLTGRVNASDHRQEIYQEPESIEPEPTLDHDHGALFVFQVSFPPDQIITKDASERFLMSLSRSNTSIAFEIIGTAESIIVQIACRKPDKTLVRHQLAAYFADAVVSENDFSRDAIGDNWGGEEGLIIDFGLSQEFMRPISSFKTFDVDPLVGITGALGGLMEGEVGLVQILFQGVENPWAENIMRSVTDFEGKSFFLDAPEMLPLARDKVEFPLFAVVIRAGAISDDLNRSADIVKTIGGALTQFSRPGSNEFIPLTNDDYDDFDHELDLFGRTTRRSGMLLNARELASLAHPPSASVRSQKLKREIKRTKVAPNIALGHRFILGENSHQGRAITVTLSPEQRLKHTHVIGATGTGKSTLLLNSIIQDINNGEGLGVIDPHGDLIDQILGHIPEKRFDDVVLFDPADTDYPIGFNILSAHSELEKNILASDLGAVFRRLSTSWGDQMTSVLGNAIIAFLESDKGGTLLDLRHFLIDADFRTSFLKSVKDREVIYFWQKEFPLLTGRPQAPVLTRLDTFLRPKIIRNMVGQKDNRINFEGILNNRKIFLVKLAQGLIGEENAYLLGAFIVSKLHQVVMGRQDLGERERQNFWLYIDEFQNFITPSMAAILSGARKYHLGLILSHQDMEQLSKRDSEVASSVISNPSTRICFRLGDFDAKKLRDGFSFFGADDLQNLGVGEAICRVERAEYDFNLKTLPLLEIESGLAGHRRGSVMVLSRTKYSRRREEVEADLFKEEPPTDAPPRRDETAQAENAEPPPRTEEETRGAKETPGARAQSNEVKDKQRTPPREEPIRSPKPERTKEQSGGRPRPQESSSPGRGGQQHKYLQSLIKRMGEDKDYRATIEKEILGGIGKIDIALEKDGRSIACEISISTNVEHELANIQKCIAGGFEQIVLISSDKKVLLSAKKLATTALSEQDQNRVNYLTPEEFLSFLEEQEAQSAAKEQTVRGYKVKVKYKAVNETEKKARKKVIAETVLKALRKMKDK